MLMAGHTPKSKLSVTPQNRSSKKSPSFLVQKHSPVRKTPRGKGRQSGRSSKGDGSSPDGTPARGGSFAQDSSNRRSSKRYSGNRSVTVLEVTDSTQNSTRATDVSTRSRNTSLKSPTSRKPRKSAMKDHSKKRTRKIESIKFDLTNLESRRDSSDVTSTTRYDSASDEDLTLHYSESSNQSTSPRKSVNSTRLHYSESNNQSTSPRKSVNSTRLHYSESSNQSTSPRKSVNSTRLHYSESSNQSTSPRKSVNSTRLHYSESSNQSTSPRKSVNSTRSRASEKPVPTPSPTASWRTLTPESPRARRSIRGSAAHNALETTAWSDYTKVEQSADATVTSAFRTRTLSPRSNTNLESYSVVDLVSMDSNDTAKSVYDSADSSNVTAYNTPNVSGRKTRSTINPTLLGTSTPYVGPNVGRTRATRSKSSSNITRNRSTGSSASTRRVKSLSTPDNKQFSANNTRVSRASRSRSRINDSDLLLLDETEVEDSSPKSSKRARTTKSVAKVNMSADSPRSRGDISNDNSKLNLTGNSPENQGIITPENRYSPEAAGTPVLSIQSLLDSSRSSLISQNSGRRGRSADYRRKTLGVLSERKTRQDWKSKSLGSSVRKTLLRLSRDSDSDKTDEGAPRPDNEDTVTPKSAVKITPEAVKNKHSSAKKPQSKRSIIDDLNQSDIVKQLFNSPVKRKLSQSISEFSRKQLFDDDDIVRARRPTRNTIALSGRTPNNSVLERTTPITPERFVSPLNTPVNSPNLSGLTRLFKKNTPENDLRNVRGVKGLLRTPRTRRSLKNDLTDVRGVKAVFAKSPQNRLSDVRVKEVFAVHAVSPDNDLRRVSGVKSLFKNKSPKNDLTDVRGVRKMFKKKSPENDLRNVSGVKRTLRNTSPRNDLTDVRGVRRVFGHQKQKENYHDVSGVEELFNESNRSRSETMFDTLFGKPTVRSVYSKTISAKSLPKPKTRKGKSLHNSINITTNNVEEWLEREIQKRLHRDVAPSTSRANNSRNLTDRELQKLSTDTVAGASPVRADRTRCSSYRGKRSASQVYSAHTLPIKKRSIADGLERSKHQLPIKKRLVVHSTPVKGQASATMNASELGRVSPIAPLDVTRVLRHDTSATRPRMFIDDEPEAKLAKTRTPRKQETPRKIDIGKPSPPTSAEKPSPQKSAKKSSPPKSAKKSSPPKSVNKSSPPKSAKKSSPPKSAKKSSPPKSAKKPSPPKRPTRNSKPETTAFPTANTTKLRTSLVIAKKAPLMTPKAVTKVIAGTSSTEASSKASPKKTRATRIKKEDNVATPKRTRVRAARATVVVYKPSPKLKPQRGKAAEKSQTVENRTRKTTVAEAKVQSPKVFPRNSRKTRVNATEVSETESGKPKLLPVQNKRGRKANAVESNIVESTKTRGRKPAAVAESKSKGNQLRFSGKQVETQDIVQSNPTRGGRGKQVKTQDSVQSEPVRRGRGKQVKTQDSVQSEPVRRGRGKQVETQDIVQSEPVRRGRGKQVETQDSVQSEPVRRGRGKQVETRDSVQSEPVRRGRGKQVETQDSVQSEPIRRGRGKQVETQDSVQSEPIRRGRGKQVETQDSVQSEPVRRGRGKQVETQESVQSEPVRRGRGKQVETQDSVQSEPVRRGRGKKAEKKVETLKPVLEEKSNNTRGKKVMLEAKSKVIETKTRGKRAAPQTSAELEVLPRERRNKAEISLVSETKGRKRKGAASEEVPAKVAKADPKRGKKAEASEAETIGKQKRAVSKDKKADNSKQEAVKPNRGTRSKQVEQPKTPAEEQAKPVRGRKVAAPKEKVAEPTGRKRKANVEPTPATGYTTNVEPTPATVPVARKKRATRVAAAPSPAGPNRRAARGKPQPVVTSKAVGRSRRR